MRGNKEKFISDERTMSTKRNKWKFHDEIIQDESFANIIEQNKMQFVMITVLIQPLSDRIYTLASKLESPFCVFDSKPYSTTVWFIVPRKHFRELRTRISMHAFIMSM